MTRNYTCTYVKQSIVTLIFSCYFCFKSAKFLRKSYNLFKSKLRSKSEKSQLAKLLQRLVFLHLNNLQRVNPIVVRLRHTDKNTMFLFVFVFLLKLKSMIFTEHLFCEFLLENQKPQMFSAQKILHMYDSQYVLNQNTHPLLGILSKRHQKNSTQ